MCKKSKQIGECLGYKYLQTYTFKEYKTDYVEEVDSHDVLSTNSLDYYSEERYDQIKYYKTWKNNYIYLKLTITVIDTLSFSLMNK